jgi:DNA-binding response OmpR family regulator
VLPALRPALLLVDDDATLLDALARRLIREGFAVHTALSAARALALVEQTWPQLVVIDLMMPGVDGFELARRLKRIADLPIIVLSAVDDDEARIRAIEKYAEDYVTKPFNSDELVARIQRVLRRASIGRPRLTLANGNVEIDLVLRQVVTPAGTQPLTPTEVRFLQVLSGSLDRVVPTETLLDRVWTEADGADPSYVWVTVRRLRRKLELDPDAPQVLLTERGQGYRLVSARQTPTPVAR